MFPCHSLSLFLTSSHLQENNRENLCVVPEENPFHKCCFNVTSKQNSMLSLFNSIKMVHKVDRPWKSYQFVKISRQGIIVKSRIKKKVECFLSFWKIIRKWRRKVLWKLFKWKNHKNNNLRKLIYFTMNNSWFHFTYGPYNNFNSWS